MSKELVKGGERLASGMKFLILGAGFSGQRIASKSKTLGIETLSSRKDRDKKGADFAFDSEKNLFPSEEILKGTTHLLSCIPPSLNGKDPVIESIGNQLKSLSLKWVGYLSTTGVYGDQNGDWVNEKDLAKPQQPRSQRRLACERAWEETGLPIQILRLPGIYGPGRSAIDSVLQGKAKMVHKQGQVFSRIHVDDIAGAIIHLIELYSLGEKPKIINIADNLPTTNIEVIKYAGELLNYSLPPIENFDIASKSMSPMALSFWEENRRVSNKLLCTDLGYELLYPNYKSGLRNCLNERKNKLIN